MTRMAAPLLGAMFLVTLVACGFDSDGAPTATATLTNAATTSTGETTTATPSATGEPGDEYQVLEYREAQSLSAGMQYLLVTGCWACEGNDTGLDRVVVPASGEPYRETLLADADYPDATLQQVAGTPAVELLVATLCTGGNCHPLGESAPDTQTRVIASRDGGVTWDELAALDGYVNVLGVNEATVLIRRNHFADGDWHVEFRTVPDGTVLIPPEGSGEDARPFLLPGGAGQWLAADERRLLASDGSVAFEPQLPDDAVIYSLHFGATYEPGTQDLGPRLVEFHLPKGTGGFYLGAFLPNGAPAHAGDGVAIYRSPIGGVLHATGAPDVDLRGGMGTVNGEAVGDTAATRYPAALVMNQGLVVVLNQGPFKEVQGRNTFIAQAAANLRVTTEQGCVNVRAEPSIEGPVLACYADGVLIGAFGPSEDAEGYTWLSVPTIDGQSGWIADEFVERLGP